MRPAFSSTKQAAAFASLLIFLLSAPWLAGKRFLPPREQVYASEGWNRGTYPWIQRQIFDETNDIDIAFVGSSHIGWAIDTPYVQEKLDERLGRKAVVRSISWSFAGLDALFIITKDLLEHRHVRTLVFCDETDKIYPGIGAKNWYRFGDDAAMTSGLEFRYRLFYYFADTIVMPRNLIELLTPNLKEETNNSVPNYYEVHFHAPNPARRLGAAIVQMGYREGGKVEPFVPYLPKTDVTSSDVYIYGPATVSQFKFADLALPSWQIYLLRQFALEAENHSCKLVLLHLPMKDQIGSSEITEAAYWPDVLGTDVAMLGIPTGRLFHGMSESEIKRMFANGKHLNQNGMKYFTPLIVPALFQLYEGKPHH